MKRNKRFMVHRNGTPPVMRGRSHPWFVEPIRHICANCGAEHFRKPHVNPRSKLRFCTFACKTSYWKSHRSGSNAHDWVGGPTTYRGKSWPAARAAVVAEQRGICAHCGKFVGDGLPVNHVKPFREFTRSREANRRENLIGLCQSCHMKAEPRPHRGHGATGAAKSVGASASRSA